MTSTDIHQHLWPPSFFSALSARSQPPRLRGRALELAGAPAWELDVESHDLDTRLALMDRLELDRAVVSLQPTLGIDQLPADEALELIETWESGILELADASGGRIVPLAAGEPAARLRRPLRLRCRAARPRRTRTSARRARRRAAGFLFVHPGAAVTPPGAPSWWTAIVDYTAEMQAAYIAWLAAGAARWPELDVVFAILAGGAPIQLERMAARGVDERSAMLPHIWFDTATYGRRALDLAMSTYGVEPMLFGSDMPVVDPVPALDVIRSFGEAVTDAVLSANPARLLSRMTDIETLIAAQRQRRAHARTRRSGDARARDRRHAGALAARSFGTIRTSATSPSSTATRDLDVWLICWDNAQDTGYHDHDRSSGAVYVCAGMLCEDSFHRDDDGWMRERTREHNCRSRLRLPRVVHPRRPASGRAAGRLDPRLQPRAVANGALLLRRAGNHEPHLDDLHGRARGKQLA